MATTKREETLHSMFALAKSIGGIDSRTVKMAAKDLRVKTYKVGTSTAVNEADARRIAEYVDAMRKTAKSA